MTPSKGLKASLTHIAILKGFLSCESLLMSNYMYLFVLINRNIYWLWFITKAWGMYNYSLKRYGPLEGEIKNWDDSKPSEENQKAFGWAPGIAFRPDREDKLREVLKDHPKCEHIVSAIKEAHEW